MDRKGSPYRSSGFLDSPGNEADKESVIPHNESDLGATVGPRLGLVFKGWAGTRSLLPPPTGAGASRSVPVWGLGAFTVFRSIAFGNGAENEDTYDLCHYWQSVIEMPVEGRPSDKEVWPAQGVPGNIFFR